ncbi:GNAT family N-acetyltransferase [Paractinoplanes lichenicola]|uniref:GNAT family N-acetyltransferase n=1 Tax=Paractinoplanes lichenicola TaxID=2802976 RepID=A0ABS1VQ45_9ACTN|nr:GNAT family N-acetyltransferase [Actinoplanes lichenicola]MBL7256852.1 GNAT family N-acetyltransferase [Actinoplanes lichenicola]
MIFLSEATLAGPELESLYEICCSRPEYWRLSGDLDLDALSRAEVEAVLSDDTVVARDAGGRVVGFAQLLDEHPVDGHPWIGLLLVDGRLDRQGHGRAIVEAIEERYRSKGATALRLGVLVNNEPAYAFWQAVGYRQIDLRPDLTKSRPTRVMEKRVAREPGGRGLTGRLR